MGEWFSIEVFDGSTAADAWVTAYGDAIIETGVFFGALDWKWDHHPWGSSLEIEFGDEAGFELFRQSPVVQSAFDAVPDRLGGLLIYRGRGGSSGARWPRKPKPWLGSGAASLPTPIDFSENLMDELWAPRILVAR